MTMEDVWNGFYLHCLILDAEEQRSATANLSLTLRLPHNAPSQSERLRSALRERNRRLEGTGQEQWNHACDLCCWEFTNDDNERRMWKGFYNCKQLTWPASGQLRSVVVDGVTLGHPCCSVHDCMEPLRSVKDRFCPKHRHRVHICAVTDCEAPVEPGFKTCLTQSHRDLESWLQHSSKAMFQLKRRLERVHATQTNDSFLTISPSTEPSAEEGLEGTGADGDEDVEVDADGVCDGKPDTGNKRVRARFGRRRTHNEELCVASCGVILGRATFYGSEAPNGVRVRAVYHLYYTQLNCYARRFSCACFRPKRPSLV